MGPRNGPHTALSMGMANIFVLTVTQMCAWALDTFVLGYAPSCA